MTVTMWFDPACPYTWRTSRWLRAAAAARGESVTWRLLSLAVLNEGRDIPERYLQGMTLSRKASRVIAAVETKYGQDAVDRLYTALGQLVHDQGQVMDRDTVAEALAAAGLPDDLIGALDDEAHDLAVDESHHAAQDRVGQEAGSPVLAFGDGPGFFGPIVVPVPTGDEAQRLFDAMTLLSTVPQFSELKRVRASL
jgi:2-hydroxychromene-2-carboxylate isomerase